MVPLLVTAQGLGLPSIGRKYPVLVATSMSGNPYFRRPQALSFGVSSAMAQQLCIARLHLQRHNSYPMQHPCQTVRTSPSRALKKRSSAASRCVCARATDREVVRGE